MTTSAAPAPVTVPTLAELSTAQLSERMGKLAERHDVLKASVSEYETVKTDLNATVAEFQKRLGTTVHGTSAKKDAPRRAKKEGDSKFPSLKEIVLTILQKNPDGLDLNGIRIEVDAMIKRGEYSSNAKSLSAVISQAVNGLKQEELIKRDEESRKYSHAGKAA
jgi:hypothetical protein